MRPACPRSYGRLMTIEEFLAKWTTAERDGDTTAVEPWLTDDC